jgi:23S rRNA (cytosine1962-C5)-methyltransferase
VGEGSAQIAQSFFVDKLPWVQTIVLKRRYATDIAHRHGVVIYGENPDRKIREHHIWYALELTRFQDASLYLDTRNLRAWAVENCRGLSVLNTFAYTGSLGVAARAGGAQRVVHLDRGREYLNLAKQSYALNGFPIQPDEFLIGDFYPLTSRMRRNHERFDCIFLDAPFFSVTSKGRVDLVNESRRLINKIRPLVNNKGYLIAINNALYLKGADYIKILQELCVDGYMSIDEIIPVPPDCSGYAHSVIRTLPVDPAPFNHATKIAILKIRRKLI